jgi:hypothetical protein
VTQLSTGDTHCATGGAAITDAGGNTAYVCNGANGADGQSFDGTFTSPNGEYSVSVTDNGIKLHDTQGASLEMAGGDVTLKGNQASLSSTTNLNLSAGAVTTVQGSLVKLGPGGCVPVALLGSLVQTPANPLGQVTTGSGTVCASQ